MKYLEERGIPYFGCDSAFVDGTTQKDRMKERFVESGVPTPKYCAITKQKPLTRFANVRVDILTHLQRTNSTHEVPAIREGS